MIWNAGPNPLLWLGLFVTLSVGATVASGRHLLQLPREAVARAVAPLQTGVSRLGHTAAGWVNDWQGMDRLRHENAALRNTVEELLQETVSLRAAELENRELREQLRYTDENQGQALVPAQVVGFDSSTLLGYAVISQASDEQLEDGMTVLSTSGLLVGRIVTRTARTSTVLLINHPSSSVNAVIQGSPGASGVVNGQADGRLRMRYIPQGEPVKVNDVVVTSGLGGAFPRNLVIGRVVQVEARDVDIFQQAVVEPYVNFRKLSHVVVATGFRPVKLR